MSIDDGGTTGASIGRRASGFEIYQDTKSFPKEETYGLTSQLRRAAVSVPSNIAEGKGRSSEKELVHFLNNARGSLFELETQINLAQRLGFLSADAAERLFTRAREVGRLVNGLIRPFRPVA